MLLNGNSKNSLIWLYAEFIRRSTPIVCESPDLASDFDSNSSLPWLIPVSRIESSHSSLLTFYISFLSLFRKVEIKMWFFIDMFVIQSHDRKEAEYHQNMEMKG